MLCNINMLCNTQANATEQAAFFARRGYTTCDAHCMKFYFCNVIHTDLPALVACVYAATKEGGWPAALGHV